uniref:Uncharacterized protein n=1 Tax=Physcomitrium patens TaxID=3218 RepID=A0A2K1JGD6_PHYPA|nr:hypothetical protein PHYPA_017981 [Physcomitrium patens]
MNASSGCGILSQPDPENPFTCLRRQKLLATQSSQCTASGSHKVETDVDKQAV